MESNTLTRPSHITDLHVERGTQMRTIVESDIVTRGYTFEQSVDLLSEYLGISRESVLLGISISNEWGC